MENREEVLLELTRFESARQLEIPAVLEDYLRHVARTGDSVFPWPKVRPLLKRKLDLITDQYCQHCPPEKIPAMPNVDPFKYEQLRTEIHFRIDSLNGTPFTIQRLCELMTEPQRYYKRTDKFMRGVEKNVLVVTTIEATRRRPPPEAVNGAVVPEESVVVASRDLPSTSGTGRPPEPPAGHTETRGQPPAIPAGTEMGMEANGAPPTASADTVPSGGDVPASSSSSVAAAFALADSQSPMELDQRASAGGDSKQAELATPEPTDLTSKTEGVPSERAEECPAVNLTATEPATAQSADQPTGAPSEPATAAVVLPSTDDQDCPVEELSSEAGRPSEQQLTSPAAAPSADPPSTPLEEESDRPEVFSDTTDKSRSPAEPPSGPREEGEADTVTAERASCEPEPVPDSAEPPAETAEPAADGASLDSSNMSLDDSLCGSEAAAGSPPPPPSADDEQAV